MLDILGDVSISGNSSHSGQVWSLRNLAIVPWLEQLEVPSNEPLSDSYKERPMWTGHSTLHTDQTQICLS